MGQYATPLRYPGGKQRLTPFVLEILEANDLIGGDYVEPYAGGAGVAMELLLRRQVSRVHINDSSYPIFAFWTAILSQPEEFCRRISSASLTIDEWKLKREILRNPRQHDIFELGYSTFYLNRCNRSGVLQGGVIGGLRQTGLWKIGARFPRNELVRRVEAIALVKDKIHVRNHDAEAYIAEYVSQLPSSTLVYCDPPYYNKSSRLYLDKYNHEDHARIASVIQKDLSRPWIVSYDRVEEIANLYNQRRSFVYDLQYSASHSYKGRETFIFSDSLTIPSKSSVPYINAALPSLTQSQAEA